MIKLLNILNELEVVRPEPNLGLFHILDKNKSLIWDTLLKFKYEEFLEDDNFNPETDIKFDLSDYSGEKKANVVYLSFLNHGDIGWEASINPKYFHIRDNEHINILQANIKNLNFYYITYDI